MLRSLRLTALSLAVVASGCGPGGAPAADPAPTVVRRVAIDLGRRLGLSKQAFEGVLEEGA